MNIDISRYIDHTLLRPDADETAVRNLCMEAMEYNFYSVCVNPCYIRLVKEILSGHGVRLSTVIGFPLGGATTETKVYEAMECIYLGANELDIVMNIGKAKGGDWDYVFREIRDIIIATPHSIHKVIIETGLLNEGEIKKAVEVVVQSGAEFVKTSTGFSSRGASIDDIRIIREVSPDIKIKASGGIRTLSQVMEFINRGVSRIGTSSGVSIMKELFERGATF